MCTRETIQWMCPKCGRSTGLYSEQPPVLCEESRQVANSRPVDRPYGHCSGGLEELPTMQRTAERMCVNCQWEQEGKQRY
ncbi:hypothetical protein CDD83_11046 [Cordyceps sp. RAO-2017]|nr:hypothetical protein CDD83_11046 [Cordyceps sp. RAO-2017]